MSVLNLVLIVLILILVVSGFQARGPESDHAHGYARIFLVIAVLLILLLAFLVFRIVMLFKVNNSLETKPCTMPMDTFQPLPPATPAYIDII